MAILNVKDLGKSPAVVTLVAVQTGNTFQMKDDGGSITSDGFFPNLKRQILLAKASEEYRHEHKKGAPQFKAWVLAEAIPASNCTPDKDPAKRFAKLDDVVDFFNKKITYRELIEINKKAAEDKRKKDMMRMIVDAKALGADAKFIERLENVVDRKPEEAPLSSDEGVEPEAKKGKK